MKDLHTVPMLNFSMFRPISALASTLCAALLSYTSASMADTIVLKTGERLDVKITKATDTTVEAEVRMSSSITDLRVFQKTDIANIEKPDPAEEAYAAVKAGGPGPNSLSASQYDVNIHTQLNPFIGKYPTSPHASQVKEMIAALEREKKRVEVGEVKIDNIWYTAADLEKQKDQVNAVLLLQQMKTMGQAGDFRGALNLFTQLEKTYPTSRAYPAAVDYATQLIPNVQSEINTKKTILANDLSERKKGLEVLPDFRKAPLIAAAAEEEAQANAALDTAIKSGTKWTPIYPRNQKSIDELQKTVTSETTRLAAIKTAPMLTSIAAVADARKQIETGDVDAATASLQKATTLWSANAMLKDANADLAKAKITPTPTPTPAPPLNATPAPARGAAKVIPPTATSPAATPASAPTAPITAPSPIPNAPKSASGVPAGSAEKPSFFATIPGAITILAAAAVIAGCVSIGMKLKSKKNASADT